MRTDRFDMLKILVAVPWRDKCQSLRLMRALIPRDRSEEVIWFREPGSPGAEALLAENPFNFEPFPRLRPLNSLAYRSGLYYFAQEMCIGRRVTEAAALLARLIARTNPDVVWGLGHVQQVAVLQEVFRHVSTPLHISVHDEPVVYMRRISGWPNRQTRMVENAWPRLLRRAHSIDSVSDGMRRYLLETYGRDSEVLMPCPRFPVSDEPVPALDGCLRVGLSGSSSLGRNIQALVNGLDRFVRERKLERAELLWVDGRTDLLRLPATVGLRVFDFMDEATAIRELQKCHFLHLPYWFDEEFEAAGTTSFPSKLSMYLPACRPILFHAPEPATPIRFSRKANLGAAWTNLEEQDLVAIIDELLEQGRNFRALREQYAGVIDEEFNISRNQERMWALLEDTARSLPRRAANTG
jgi:hypothetical protein